MRLSAPFEITTEGARGLVAELIASSIEDYRKLANAGAIKNGKTNPDAFWNESGYKMLPDLTGRVRRCRVTKNWLKQPYDVYNCRPEIEELILFFRKGGYMDEWISLAAIDLDPEVIRTKLAKL